MAKKYLDYDGLLYFWQKIKAAFVADIGFNSSTNYITKTKNGNTSNVVQLPSGVSPSTTTPKMDGTAATGSETAFARGDHVHPSDTSRVPTTRTVNGIALSSDVTIAADDIEAIGGIYQDADTLAEEILHIDTLLSTKVDKVTNKGLSTNDYTTAEKNKLAGIAAGATVDDHKWNDVELSKATTGYNSDTDVRYIPVLTATTGTTSTLIPTVVGSDAIQSSSLAYRMPRYNASGYLHGTTAANGDATAKLATTLFVYNQFVSKIGKANGICPLDSNSKVDAQYLPSYVDDVIEAYPRSGQTELSQNWLATESASGTVITPEAGKIYVLMADSTSYAANSQFRWGGTAYVKLADGGVSSITNAEIDTIVAA